MSMPWLCTFSPSILHQDLDQRPTVDQPAVPPNLAGPTRLQVAHLDHPLHESPKKLVLVLAENPNVLPGLRRGVQRLIGVQEPFLGHQVLEVLVVEHVRRGVEVPRDIPVPAKRTQPVEPGLVPGVHLRVGLARAGLVVEPERDREAPAIPDGMGAREGHHVSGGEVVLSEEVDQKGGVASRARHDPVRVLLARR